MVAIGGWGCYQKFEVNVVPIGGWGYYQNHSISQSFNLSFD